MAHGIVIIGTGLAGYNLAREFRKLDSETPLTLISEDDGAFYSKPMLSNALAKNKRPADLPMNDAQGMAAQLNARILTHRHVMSIEADRMQLTLDKAETLSYDRLVLAVGASPIRFAMQGNAADEVLTVNNLNDYAKFRERLLPGKRVAIIGPGLIGCEFANDLSSSGYQVHVIGPDLAPMSSLLPQPAGEMLQAALSELGVQWHLQRTVVAVNRPADQYELTLSDDTSVTADLVLSAIGLQPNTQLAQAAGLKVERGIMVDRYMQTSAKEIYALGDCAQVEGLVLPYVMPLMNGARALARTLHGEPAAVDYPAMPVLVKTPAMSTVVLPAPRDAEGQWHFEHSEGGLRAEFKNGDMLLGFALLGEAVAHKPVLTRQAPALF